MAKTSKSSITKICRHFGGIDGQLSSVSVTVDIGVDWQEVDSSLAPYDMTAEEISQWCSSAPPGPVPPPVKTTTEVASLTALSAGTAWLTGDDAQQWGEERGLPVVSSD